MTHPEPRNTGMIYRRLGRSGLHVSAISLGGWMTYGGYADDESSFACMKKAYDLGINLFDNAENYSAGQSEVVMGKAIKHFGWKRSDLVITTSKYTSSGSEKHANSPQRSTGAPSTARSSLTTTGSRASTSLKA